MSKPTFASRFFLQILKNAHGGTVQLTMPDGKVECFGEGEPTIKVTVKNWAVFAQLVSRGDLGLAEAIIDGDIEVNDTVALVQWACNNDQALSRALHGTLRGTLISQIRHLLSMNSRKGAKKNIMAHYDLGNEFFRLWLDPTMTYSSGIFEDEKQSLTSAQIAKYDRLIDQLNIKSGDHVLEIGCGWGGFFSHAVERTGCKVTAVMNSPEQARHNRQLVSDRGMTGNVSLQEMDYRDIAGKFDKVVSIEMIEAVGQKYWRNYFGKVSSSLKANGEAMIQGITIKEDFFNSYRKQTDFIQQYIFPGGMLLTNKAFLQQSAQQNMRLNEIYEFGPSYAHTLKVWRDNFTKRRTEVLAMGLDEKFIRLWDFYLAYCEGAFRAGRINVGHYHVQSL